MTDPALLAERRASVREVMTFLWITSQAEKVSSQAEELKAEDAVRRMFDEDWR